MPYRSDKLRKLARDVPHCMFCGADNHGQVVLAHSNNLEHGKGMGQKAHDIPCYLCTDCHDYVDGRSRASIYDGLTPEQVMAKATYNSALWLLQSGHLKVA